MAAEKAGGACDESQHRRSCCSVTVFSEKSSNVHFQRRHSGIAERRSEKPRLARNSTLPYPGRPVRVKGGNYDAEADRNNYVGRGTWNLWDRRCGSSSTLASGAMGVGGRPGCKA